MKAKQNKEFITSTQISQLSKIDISHVTRPHQTASLPQHYPDTPLSGCDNPPPPLPQQEGNSDTLQTKRTLSEESSIDD